VDLLEQGAINPRTAKELFREVVASGASPAELVRARGLGQVSDPEAIDAACRDAIEAHPGAAEDVRGGNRKALGRLIGAAMKALGGRGDPARVTEALKRRLGRS
jgi:aspartyl-tRNA(Asn)/glutamyl-tRNA(Gln) amidotransferase subunit B